MNFTRSFLACCMLALAAIGLGALLQSLLPHVTYATRQGQGLYAVTMPDYQKYSKPGVDFSYRLIIHAPLGVFIPRQWHFLPDDCVTSIAVDGKPLHIGDIGNA